MRDTDHIDDRGMAPSRSLQLASVDDLAHLYMRHSQHMLRLAHLMTGSSALAEEVVHDAFIAVYAKRYDVNNPPAYLRRAVVKQCQTLLRRRSIEQRKLDTIGGWLQANGHRQPPDIDETWQALWSLSDRQRIAVTLRYYEDLAVGDIAEAMGVRPGTVKSLLHRGLEQLRKELGDEPA